MLENVVMPSWNIPTYKVGLHNQPAGRKTLIKYFHKSKGEILLGIQSQFNSLMAKYITQFLVTNLSSSEYIYNVYLMYIV